MRLAKAKNVLRGILVPIFSPLARMPTPFHTAVRWPGMPGLGHGPSGT